MAPLAFGLVYDLLGTYPREPGDPPDVDAEFEPEVTLEVLEATVAGVPQAVAHSTEDAETLTLPDIYPLFVKPRWEGTAKGIGPSSRVEDRAALVREVARIVREYRQPALVETFLEGPEYTVTVVGNDPPRALPALQRALEAGTKIGLHALERHRAPQGGWRGELPGRFDAVLEDELAALAVRAYRALECLDFARADFKLDAGGGGRFLEMNPVPSFAPDAASSC